MAPPCLQVALLYSKPGARRIFLFSWLIKYSYIIDSISHLQRLCSSPNDKVIILPESLKQKQINAHHLLAVCLGDFMTWNHFHAHPIPNQLRQLQPNFMCNIPPTPWGSRWLKRLKNLLSRYPRHIYNSALALMCLAPVQESYGASISAGMPLLWGTGMWAERPTRRWAQMCQGTHVWLVLLLLLPNEDKRKFPFLLE